MDAACEALGRQINIMEVCGTHTVAIFRNGIRSTLPKQLKLLSGPGCPVCVTDQSYIDIVLQMADRDDCIIATYGDMIRVPGKGGSLETKSTRANVKVVLSSEDALQLAKDNPNKTVVFVAVGFETTAPATAVVVKEAAEQNIDNFCILSGHKLVVPAMRALVSEKNHNIDAFLCPGHVSVIIGYGAFTEVVENFSRPCVVAGFEPIQIIEGLAEICRQLTTGKAELNSVYTAAVTKNGNTTAQKIMAECFEAADGYWRGLGKIEKSTLILRDQYSQFDALKRFNVTEVPAEDTSGCRCGEVLCGLIEPPECGLFKKSCTTETPVGPCMVSSEGACAAWFKYGPER
ncbi:MAG: hydrogenase formation protein HypD [Phycisphaerae bacterium]|nr:hydrogenase formation protein HypD [Phycisphaerae bacterium]NIS49704.1 hydrogenase formation protein HypD [Phycisphaerae bacterium]NIU07436.1 hydrogenase formation protein HypD [Phycisphaerae bacterium]NIU55020.1 hydrogenase formation protein HypD [Phycisphaerae bacterium]NIW91493.1 hydrogenase formation protein HypD [Phycisphaerae bacterium]